LGILITLTGVSDDSVYTGIAVVERRALRLSGSGATPRWRGRSHLLALVVAVPAAVAIYDRLPGFPMAVYAVGLIGLFAISSAYHLLPLPTATRHVLRRVDHAAIYLFMAASFTPLCAIAAPDLVGRVVLAGVWIATLGGALMKLVGFNRSHRWGTALYLIVGWSALVVLPRVAHLVGPGGLVLFAVMGILYTGGAVVLFTRRPDPIPHVFGYHEIWHAAVVIASACYYLLLWRLIPVVR
jgi:hemolysin III